MAIYLLKQRIVLDVVDDPCRDGVDTEAFGPLAVLPLTSAELARLKPESLMPWAPGAALWPPATQQGDGTA